MERAARGFLDVIAEVTGTPPLPVVPPTAHTHAIPLSPGAGTHSGTYHCPDRG